MSGHKNEILESDTKKKKTENRREGTPIPNIHNIGIMDFVSSVIYLKKKITYYKIFPFIKTELSSTTLSHGI